MKAAVADLLRRCAPHVPCAALAELWRAGEPFPTGGETRRGEVRGNEPPVDAAPDSGGFQHVLDTGGWTGELLTSGDYIRFDCPDCHSLLFEPNTRRGIAHALRVARAHRPRCCADRAACYARTGVPAVWPDRVDE